MAGVDVRVEELLLSNFLSFREARVGLGKLNVFVGPNASGKSNLVKAIRLLSSVPRFGVPALPGYGGFKDVVFGFDVTREVRVGIGLRVGGRGVTYVLRLLSGDYFEEAFIDGEVVLESRGSSNVAKILTEDGLKEFIKPSSLSAPPSAIYSGVWASALSALPSNAVRELHVLAKVLEGAGTYSFTPKDLRSRVPVTAPPRLDYHGSNLGRAVLHLYLEDRQAFRAVEEAVKALVPEVEEVIPHIEGSDVEVWLRVKGLPNPLRPGNASDGTLRMLAFAVALHSCRGLVAVEEPENCVHPHLLEAVTHLARNSPCQVLMTTHSPYLLDHLSPEEVYVVSKAGTESRVVRLSESSDVEAVKKFLEEGGTLGEAWYSGIITEQAGP